MAVQHYEREKKNITIQGSSGFNYTRPSYAAFYPKPGTNGDPNSMPGPSSSSLPSSLYSNKRFNLYNKYGEPSNRPFQSDFSQTYQSSRPSFGNGPMDFPVEALRQRGIAVQHFILKKDSFLADPTGGPDMYLMAGEKIYVIRSTKGTYLRLNNGRFIAVRKASTSIGHASLQVPHTEDLSKEQLNAIVYSLLKIPGRSSYMGGGGDYCRESQRDLPPSYTSSASYLPLEQPLPPSSSIMPSPNRYDVPSARSNDSGGNVTVGEKNEMMSSPSNANGNSMDYNATTMPHMQPASSSFNFMETYNLYQNNLAAAARSARNGGSRFNSESLSRLSRLTESLPYHHFGRPSVNDNGNDLRSESHEDSGSVSLDNTDFSANTAMDLAYRESVIPGSELEVIPISQQTSRTEAMKQTTDASSSVESFWRQKAQEISSSWDVNAISSRQSVHDFNAAFYKDFTITVNSQSQQQRPEGNSASGNGNRNESMESGNLTSEVATEAYNGRNQFSRSYSSKVGQTSFYDEVSGSSSSDSAQLARSIAVLDENIMSNVNGEQFMNTNASYS